MLAWTWHLICNFGDCDSKTLPLSANRASSSTMILSELFASLPIHFTMHGGKIHLHSFLNRFITASVVLHFLITEQLIWKDSSTQTPFITIVCFMMVNYHKSPQYTTHFHHDVHCSYCHIVCFFFLVLSSLCLMYKFVTKLAFRCSMFSV